MYTCSDSLPVCLPFIYEGIYTFLSISFHFQMVVATCRGVVILVGQKYVCVGIFNDHLDIEFSMKFVEIDADDDENISKDFLQRLPNLQG